MVYHKHTQYPGPGRTEGNVVGYPVFPVYMAKAGGFFFIVFGVITLMGGLMQINPLWTYGPYNPAQVTAGTQPDWYMGFVEGAIRIMPNWESHIGDTTWSWNVAIPGLGLMGLMAVSMALYPFVEQWVTGDKSEHHILDRPRNNPTRTAFGVAAMTCYGLFWIGGGNDLVATQFHVSLNSVTYFLRVRCSWSGDRLHHHQADLHRSAAGGRGAAVHGAETAIIVRDPPGVLRGAHADRPGGGVHAHPARRAAGAGRRRRPGRSDGQGAQGRAASPQGDPVLVLDELRKPTRAELEAAAHHHDDDHGDGNGHGEIGNGHADGHGNGHGTEEIGAGSSARGSQDCQPAPPQRRLALRGGASLRCGRVTPSISDSAGCSNMRGVTAGTGGRPVWVWSPAQLG